MNTCMCVCVRILSIYIYFLKRFYKRLLLRFSRSVNLRLRPVAFVSLCKRSLIEHTFYNNVSFFFLFHFVVGAGAGAATVIVSLQHMKKTTALGLCSTTEHITIISMLLHVQAKVLG